MGLFFLTVGIVGVQAQTYTETILYNFPLSPAGYYPHPRSLVIDSAGNLYGAAPGGGSCDGNAGSCGILFELSTNGTFSALYNFSGQSDGFGPCCLVIDKSGDLYGTTGGGGVGWGTIFKFATTTKKFSTLHEFRRISSDGINPAGPLTLGSDGNLYGVTTEGGANGYGVLFKVTPKGRESVVFNFTVANYPIFSGLTNILRDAEGNFFGVMSFCCLIEITSGGVELTLATPGSNSGSYFLQGTLARDASGNFYGGFEDGAINDGVWEVNGSTFAVSYFNSFGGYPTGPLMFSGGDVHGTVSPGGVYNEGYVYDLSVATGVQSHLYDFGAYPTDGANPFGGIVRDSHGSRYGTTDVGGIFGYGTIFKLTEN
jgi:uncharacterized repeat protein (TIGR03803 family)